MFRFSEFLLYYIILYVYIPFVVNTFKFGKFTFFLFECRKYNKLNHLCVTYACVRYIYMCITILSCRIYIPRSKWILPLCLFVKTLLICCCCFHKKKRFAAIETGFTVTNIRTTINPIMYMYFDNINLTNNCITRL